MYVEKLSFRNMDEMMALFWGRGGRGWGVRVYHLIGLMSGTFKGYGLGRIKIPNQSFQGKWQMAQIYLISLHFKTNQLGDFQLLAVSTHRPREWSED